MKNIWNNGKSVVPPVDQETTAKLKDGKRSTRLLILLPGFGGVNTPEHIYFGYYHHDYGDWIVEGATSTRGFENIYWSYVPEFNGEIKTIIKKIKRKQDG